MHAKFLDTLDWGILIAYFLILIAIGIWASSKRKKGSSLFLAEHSLRWHHIGFSMWGTNVGPSMLIASASAGFTTGIVSGNYAWYAFVFMSIIGLCMRFATIAHTPDMTTARRTSTICKPPFRCTVDRKSTRLNSSHT